jgi:sugar lactone lactonase YvrE
MNRVALFLATFALVAAGCKSTGGGGAKEGSASSARTGSSATTPSAGPYGKPGFVTMPGDEGRLWVFRSDAKELDEFKQQGELAKHVTRPGAGPGGITLKAPDSETILEFAAACDGFQTFVRDGRIWVFRPGTKDLEEFRKTGEPAKSITRPNAGPMRMTVRGPDIETVTEYICARDGFVTHFEDGRLWVFRSDAKELGEFKQQGELAKHVTRPGAGPGGITLKAPDSETIVEYAAARDGFVTFLRDGRIWVFRPGTKDLAEFLETGEPAKSVTRPNAGPLRMTVRGPDIETIDGYLLP